MTPRGALEDAPRRDTTMTQNSDSGDAVGDAGPKTDRAANMQSQGKKRVYECKALSAAILPIHVDLDAALCGPA